MREVYHINYARENLDQFPVAVVQAKLQANCTLCCDEDTDHSNLVDEEAFPLDDEPDLPHDVRENLKAADAPAFSGARGTGFPDPAEHEEVAPPPEHAAAFSSSSRASSRSRTWFGFLQR